MKGKILVAGRYGGVGRFISSTDEVGSFLDDNVGLVAMCVDNLVASQCLGVPRLCLLDEVVLC